MNESNPTLIGAAGTYGVIDELAASGAVTAIAADAADTEALADCLAADGLSVMFFAGGARRRRESHDVAVALRELLREYEGYVRCALIQDAANVELKTQFRVVVEPSLVFVLDGSVLEVVPGIRDWAEYAAAFRRYLGNPRQQRGASA